MSKQSTTPSPTQATTPTVQTLDETIKSTIEALVAVPQPDGTMARYTSLDKSARARVRSAIEARSRSTLQKATDLDGLAEAKRLVALHESLKASGSSTPKVEVDPAEIIATRIATLRLAADLLESGMVAPDGLEPVMFDPKERSEDYVGPVSYATAYDLATAKVTRTSPTHKVEDAMVAAFTGQPVGTFLTVAQVRSAWVAAGGPDKSDGRISARLFAESGCTLANVEPVPATATTPKGVRLVKAFTV